MTSEIESVLTFFRGFSARDFNLLGRHIDPARFVQHVASATEAFDDLKEKISVSSQEDHSLRVIRIFQDGPYVVTQAEGSILGQNVFFDVFRVEDEAIVERWTFSDKAAPPNPSGHTQIDGPVESRTDQDTERNKSLVRKYYEIVHIEGQHNEIPRFVWDGCIRHEAGVCDGIEAFVRDVEEATQRGKLSRSIDTIQLLLGEGDFVFITACGSIEREPCTFVDLYRVADDKIVEHWGFPEKL